MNKRIAQTSQEVRHIWACWDFKSICRLIMDYSGDIIKILTKLIRDKCARDSCKRRIWRSVIHISCCQSLRLFPSVLWQGLNTALGLADSLSVGKLREQLASHNESAGCFQAILEPGAGLVGIRVVKSPLRVLCLDMFTTRYNMTLVTYGRVFIS